jgi:hypothetical protein
MGELLEKLNRLKITLDYYEELSRSQSKDSIELENIKLKMQFAKKEMLLLLMEVDKLMEKNADTT